jgi:hypothetical protein
MEPARKTLAERSSELWKDIFAIPLSTINPGYLISSSGSEANPGQEPKSPSEATLSASIHQNFLSQAKISTHNGAFFFSWPSHFPKAQGGHDSVGKTWDFLGHWCQQWEDLLFFHMQTWCLFALL